MSRLTICLILLLSFLCINGCRTVGIQQSDSSGLETRRYDAELENLRVFKKLCADENAVLWHQSLCVPVVIVNPSNHSAITTVPDPTETFQQANGVYVGNYDGPAIYANTSLIWGSQRWSMVLSPLPEDQFLRNQLLFHEAFHSIQDTLGLPMNDAINNHLDRKNARILVRLEWNALMTALEDPKQRTKHITNALSFRRKRFAEFKTAKNSEEKLELNEGLAEYTGVKLRGTSEEETLRFLKEKVRASGDVPGLIRSAAYYSGPLYGLLLDEGEANWRSVVGKPLGLGDLLAKSFSISGHDILKEPAALFLSTYNYEAIKKSENQRDLVTRANIRRYRSQIEKPGRLKLELKSPQTVFDPFGIFALEDGEGAIYSKIEVTDVWGRVESSNGALQTGSSSSRILTLSPPKNVSDTEAEGDGWILKLNKGWTIKKGNEAYEVRRSPSDAS